MSTRSDPPDRKRVVAGADGCCLHDLFVEQVQRNPAAIAVACGVEELSYRGLDARSSRLADCLRALGVGAEVVVAVMLPRSIELIVALLAILKAGGAYLPLDPSYPPERLGHILFCRARRKR